ncbi:MAG: hypothetical protein ABH885_02325 [Candidatus Omnitrophota bacterium]
MRKVFVSAIALLLLLGRCPSSDAKNLYKAFKHYPTVKIYLGDVVNNSGSDNVSVDEFRRVFQEVVKGRINMNFAIVSNPKDADVVITADIKRYSYQKRALPSFTSGYAFVADVTAPKSNTKLVVDYTLTNPNTGEVLMALKNFTTVDRQRQKEGTVKSVYLAAVTRSVSRMMFRAFYEPRPGDRV